MNNPNWLKCISHYKTKRKYINQKQQCYNVFRLSWAIPTHISKHFSSSTLHLTKAKQYWYKAHMLLFLKFYFLCMIWILTISVKSYVHIVGRDLNPPFWIINQIEEKVLKRPNCPKLQDYWFIECYRDYLEKMGQIGIFFPDKRKTRFKEVMPPPPQSSTDNMAILDLQLFFVKGHRGPGAQNICHGNLQTFQNTHQDVL